MKKPINNYLKGKNILPISLLSGEKHGLVVGGGKTAYRKVIAMLDAGAEITVVAPEFDPQFCRLTENKRINLIKRVFQIKDLEGKFIVYAATNDRNLNLSILKHCRTQRILCNIVDKGWHDSDFITPAIFNWNGLTISVSSGGRSCRHSRLIKEQIGQYLTALQNVNLIVIGTDHRLLPISKREIFHRCHTEINKLGMKLSRFTGVLEFMLLITCNRVEFLGIISEDETLEDLIIDFLGFNNLKKSEYYHLREIKAFHHLGYVLSGMYSQMIGENHIVSQVKTTIDRALEMKWADTIMRDWIDKSLSLSKKIRNKTALLLTQYEIEEACIHYLKDKLGSLKGKMIMILGTGDVGTRLIELLLKEQADLQVMFHQNQPDSIQIHRPYLMMSPIVKINENLTGQRVIISALQTSKYVLDEYCLNFFDGQQTVEIIDLSIPRSVDPKLPEKCEHINLKNLDDLKKWSLKHNANAGKAFKLATQIANGENLTYEKLISSIKNRHTGQ